MHKAACRMRKNATNKAQERLNAGDPGTQPRAWLVTTFTLPAQLGASYDSTKTLVLLQK